MVKLPILNDFEIEALEKGRKEGRQKTLLTQHFGTLMTKTEQRIKGLNLDWLEQLSQSLLTLTDKAVLEAWLQKKTTYNLFAILF